MKLFILSISVMILNLSFADAAEKKCFIRNSSTGETEATLCPEPERTSSVGALTTIVESMCGLQGKNNDYSIVNSANIACAKASPTFVMHELFKESFPDISFARTELNDPNSVFVQFGVRQGQHNFGYYVREASDGKVELTQGQPGDPCYYKFDPIELNGNQRKLCKAELPKNPACAAMWSADPVRNPSRDLKFCNVFLEAMLSCRNESKDCKTGFARYMNASDESGPTPNPNQIPRPASSPGIGDNIPSRTER